ncbi:MAG: glycosyltransferase family 2 protein [Armatimonadetes bacterium]|nr:glycosyltransferase family 2 protein [Armatimonadota bacterium]
MAVTAPFLSLIIPAYNERSRIAGSVRAVCTFLDTLNMSYEIVVVDDGSTDDTVGAVPVDDRVKTISYEINRGKGHAVRMGIAASHGEYVAFSDADLSAPIEEITKLFDAISSGADVAIGSRAMQQSKLLMRQPLYRELGGKTLNLAIQILAVPGIRDTQCGFKLFKGDLARRIFKECILDGWGFDVEALYLARRLGCSIAEVPIRWAHSADSKISPFSAGLQVLKDLVRIRLRKYRL